MWKKQHDPHLLNEPYKLEHIEDGSPQRRKRSKTMQYFEKRGTHGVLPKSYLRITAAATELRHHQSSQARHSGNRNARDVKTHRLCKSTTPPEPNLDLVQLPACALQPPSRPGIGARLLRVAYKRRMELEQNSPPVENSTPEDHQSPEQSSLIYPDNQHSPQLEDRQHVSLANRHSHWHYPQTLNCQELPASSRFPENKFLGRGNLAIALGTPRPRSFSSTTSNHTFGDIEFVWGAYDNSVGTSFEVALGMIADGLEEESETVGLWGMEEEEFLYQVYTFFSFICCYISEILSFGPGVELHYLLRINNKSIETKIQRSRVKLEIITRSGNSIPSNSSASAIIWNMH
jgi:hypothetical protein